MAGSPDLSFDPASMSNAVDAVLNDCLYNIIADTVLKVHREEKQARMQSAAILAQQSKDAAGGESPGADAGDGAADPAAVPQTFTTAGARIDEDNRIFLHENPLRSTPDVLCPTCRLPRLQHPTAGRGARAPDPAREYCARQPFVDKDGCDVYGKSLVPERPSKKKKTEDKKGSRSGSDSDTPVNGKEEKSKPAAQSIPSGKCPYCPRYMAFTRIAQHMDRCLKSQQRQNPAAAAKKDGRLDTPRSASRASTPKPGAKADDDRGSAAKPKDAATNGKKRKLEDQDDDPDEAVTPVKKKKVKKEKDRKNGTPGLERKDSNADSASGKDKKDKKAEKKPPGA